MTKGTKRDRKGQKGTERDKKGQKGTKRDRKGQKGMTEKELEKVYYLTREKKKIQERISSLNVYPSSGLGEHVSGGTRLSPQTKHSERIDPYITQLVDLQSQISLQIVAIEKYISSVNDPLMQIIIDSRYIQLKSWTAVAEDAGGGNTADSVRKYKDRFFEKNQ